ncbi:hypothetical protein JCM4814A_35680 [Streptomyces phaeofaciens JCM 4814]|uniref:PLD phosphodiesterase domain-containing protein n=1 Tax=Streptomyces phaeofaciens TaxID=68254 RepID=A0A918HQC3_9ACTN|nr:hypothetical protein [Streptomyces phaeofaciens]GGT84752.1 hypothetical protein GCM10010226_74240 [Streptomyces phaeofaciens]
MAQDVELAIPCRLVTLSLLLGPEEGLTTLEDLVAKAVAAGRTTVEDHAELFALPRRIVLDVVHSLWRKGHVMVDFTSGTLELTDGAREVITSDGSLRDSSVRQEHRQFLFEPVTGRVFPADAGTRRPSQASLHVPLHQVLSETDLPAAELLRAVQTAIRNDRHSRGFRQNVLDVGFRSPVLRPASELRWLGAHAQVFLDSDTGRISARLLDEPGWNSRARERMRQHLADLADQQPDHTFVRALRGRAMPQLAPAESAESLLHRMGETIGSLSEVEAHQVSTRQKVLADLSRRLSARIAEIGRAKAAVTVVARAAGHQWTVEDLIQSARNQLVFATPNIGYSALSAILPLLRKALERGVHLVFLWGRRDSDTLPDRVRTALYDLEARHRSRVLFADRSARTSACVVVQDNQRAFVGTHSPLDVNTARTNRGEVGILIEGAAQDGPPGVPQSVTDLLIWARKSFPYWQLGQRILVQDDHFESVPERRRTEPAAVSPPGEEEGRMAVLRQDASARGLWAESWAEHHAVLTDVLYRATKGDPVVEILEDGAPRDLVQQALHTATRRLLLADDSVDARALDERLVAVLGGRIDQGVSVQLIRPTARGQEQPSTQPALRELTRRGLKVRDERAGARAAVWDDEAVLGSLPLLRERRRALLPSERTSQVSVHIRGADAVTRIAAELGVPPERDPEPPAAAEPDGRLRGATAVALSLLVEVGAERGSAQYVATVAERLRQVDDLWGVLDIWYDKQVAPKDLRPVVAAALIQERETRGEDWSRWADWLIADAWDRRAFVEASLLGRLLRDGEKTVPPAACTATAAIETGPLGTVLLDAALELAYCDPAAQAVGAAAGLAETLLRGLPGEGPAVLDLLAEALPPSWQELAEAARRHRADGNGPLPLALLVSELSRMTELSETAEQWAELVDQIDRMERLHRFTFDSGKFLHRELFAKGGMLSSIRVAAEAGTDECVRIQAGLPVNVRRHLDQIVADGGRPEIQWGNQRTFLQTIEDIVRRARSLTPLPNERGATVGAAAELAGCAQLAELIAARWDALFSEAGGLGRPYASPLLALLDRLDPLAQWHRSRRGRRTEER